MYLGGTASLIPFIEHNDFLILSPRSTLLELGRNAKCPWIQRFLLYPNIKERSFRLIPTRFFNQEMEIL
ncbi:RNA-binding protein mde7 [Bienertia sinuspersici]